MLITSWLRSVQTRLILNRRRSLRRRPERESNPSAERLEDRTLLAAPTLVAVKPNVGEFLQPDEVRNIAPQQIVLQFNPGQQIDPTTLGGITVTRSVDGVFNNGDDVDAPLGFVGLGDTPEEVVLRFAENLPDDHYEIFIPGSGSDALRNLAGERFNNGSDDSFPFELDLGAQIIAAVPQPVTDVAGTLDQSFDEIVLYFNDDELDPVAAIDPGFYQLIFTNDTVTNQDDVTFNPMTVTYDNMENTAVLKFATDIHLLGGAGPGTYRLRVGTREATPPVPIETLVGVDPGSAFRTADNNVGIISAAGNTSHLLTQSIDPVAYPFEWPGADDEPGHREIEHEHHLHGPADSTPGVTTVFYNFQDDYGFDPQGNQLQNLITPNQRDRAREVFEFYSNYGGLDFVETENLGFTIVTGDPRAIDPTVPTGPGGVIGLAGGGLAIMDSAETWDDTRGGNWFETAMHEIGHLLGLGHSYELPALTVQGSEPLAGNGLAEPDFPGDHDITHLQHLFRPDSNDIDLYRFEVQDKGLFTSEIIAERRGNSTNLDSVLRLFKENPLDGSREMIAQNDDYFSEDSFIELPLEPGVYYIGVSASGNDDYDPVIEDTGIGGTSQGGYDLRLNFRPDVDDTLIDLAPPGRDPVMFDGDLDGIEGGVYNFWFRAVAPTDVLLVDKIGRPSADGSTVFTEIDQAFAAAVPGQIVRIVGNGGGDGDLMTTADNASYQIGLDQSFPTPLPLEDGATMNVPQGVTTMIDEGAILKFHRARVGVGSATASVDNSGAGLQVLGTPNHSVFFTSWLDESIGGDTTPTPTSPASGNWGGIMFQNDVDNEETRFNYETEGIFLNYVNHADIQWGGGQVVVTTLGETINPIHMTEARPTVTFNQISLSADSALSADPDSFEETNFHAPAFQSGGRFTSDYGRVGPDIYGNILVRNSTNGLFVRVETLPGQPVNTLTVPGRFDDTDVVHVITENLEITGTPGGAFLDAQSPSVVLVKLTAQPGGTLTLGTYNYILTFVDASGNESPSSNATRDVMVAGGPEGSVLLENLPPAPAPFVGRRLYRSDSTGGGVYREIANLDVSDTTFVDDGTTLTGVLVPAAALQLARFDARLSIDPGTIVKLEAANIRGGIGATFIAEAFLGREIIFTSKLDDRHGAGGTFDTNDDDNDAVEASPGPGDWGGIYIGHMGRGSIDHALVTFGGGVTPHESDFNAFNVLEFHQSEGRVTNSVFEQNADGTGGTGPADRVDLFRNSAGTIFIRGSQPIIVDNIIRDGEGPAISVNVNALSHHNVRDAGRSRGISDHIVTFADNQGPLIRRNRLGRNAINGMDVRAETLTTQVIFDDTDIVHVVRNEILVPDFHTFGGIRLASSSDESLVVKLSGPNAGFTATGRPLDINDRIGGVLDIVGQPFRPVVLTSLNDDDFGAGLGLDGLPLTDTNNDGPSTGAPGDWRSARIAQFAHDRNVKIVVENETADEESPDTNGGVAVAEFLGQLGRHEKDSDENLRLGFEIVGSVSRAEDNDVYSFVATSGTEIWIDVDRSRHAFDSVVDLLDANGNIIAQSDNSHDELQGNFDVFTGVLNPNAHPLSQSIYQNHDRYTTNQRDAGMRVVLPGTVGSIGTFYVRVRSSNIDSLDPAADRTDLQDPTKLGDGLTFGSYHLQVRLGEIDEVPGSTVRYANIRYATDGIEILGQPVHSPLTGELAENATGPDNNNTRFQAQDAGNLLNADRAALSFAANISSDTDIDFFRFDVEIDSIQTIANFSNPSLHMPVTIDLDYADGLARGNNIVTIFDATGTPVYIGTDSNVSDDRSAPLGGADLDDLSRGTIGPLDPQIGPVELAAGTYFLAISSNMRTPAVMDQYFRANANNSATRLEPINTVTRIGDEQFEITDTNRTGSDPITDLFTIDPVTGQLADGHVVDYQLGDVQIYVSSFGWTGINDTNLYMIDAFTGDVEQHLGEFDDPVGDIDFRPDGELFAYSTAPPNVSRMPGAQNQVNNMNIGHYLRISTEDGSIAQDVGDDNVRTYGAPVATEIHIGIDYSAIGFLGTGAGDGLAVGHHRASASLDYEDNCLYQFNIQSGAVISQGLPRIGDARALEGCGTDLREIGRINAFGEVTGITQIFNSVTGRDEIYVVDTGNFLYEIRTPTHHPVASLQTRFVGQVPTTKIDPGTGERIPFSGLAAGPGAGTENGTYEELLFAIDESGAVWTFDLNAQLQNVLLDGANHVETGIPNPDGIAISTLDYNLWHVSPTEMAGSRANDAGHGIPQPPDNSVVPVPGGASLYFGNETAAADAGNKNNLSANLQRNINFPGGAQGDVVSNRFSLKGYDETDKPMLYFNYYLETDGSNADAASSTTDELRVYIGGDETFIDPATGLATNWSLVATSDNFQSATDADELDYGIGPLPTEFPLTQSFPDVQAVWENTNVWRQARLDLSNYAGRENLQLRFAFSSAGTYNIGGHAITNATTFDWSGGEELYALPGSDLRDGDTFTIDGTPFEFDSGFTLITPSGAAFTEGNGFVINGTAFEFDSDGTSAGIPVLYGPNLSASEIAENIADAVRNALPALTVAVNKNRVNLSDAGTLTQIGPMTIEGAPGTFGVPVPVHEDMTREEVAASMQVQLANIFAGGQVDAIQVTDNLIRIIGHNVDDPGPLPFSNMLPGDEFGTADGPTFGPSPRGTSNDVEGVYIDDIIIGFAERGEMIVNAPANSNYIDNLLSYNPNVDGESPDILVGPVDVEIRRAAEFGMSQDMDPSQVLFRTMDTNDRAAQQVSLVIPAADSVADGETFSISDGTNEVIFEYEDVSIGDGVEQGHFRIAFDPFAGVTGDEMADPDWVIAARVRDAINSDAVQGILDIVAGLSDGTNVGAGSTSNIVNLHGNAIVDVEKPVSTFGVLGELNDVPALNSDNLFSFENHAVGEMITSIVLTLPEGFYFDPFPGQNNPLLPNWSGFDGFSGPDVSGISDFVDETFNFNLNVLGIRDQVAIDFNSFEAGELFEFGVDIEPSDVAADYIGTAYQITFDSGRVVTGTFQNTQDINPFDHDDVIDPTRRDFVAVLAGETSIIQHDLFGDPNQFRDQGQIIVEQNIVADALNFGILADAGVRNPANIPMGGTLPHPGTTRNLQELNVANLVPGIVIANNVVARGGSGAIRFSGDGTGGVTGPIPYGRIVSNTLVSENQTGVGVQVDENAGPTLLNNVFSGLGIGIDVIGATSVANTVIGTSLYHDNATDSTAGLGTFPILLPAGDPLFIDPANDNYYPAPQSQIIDSSLNSLGDRPILITVKDPLEISVSPIQTPDLDVFGQVRADDPDVSPPDGLGSNVFKDRGAIDRVDFFNPVSFLANPEDQATTDLDPDVNEVWLDETDDLRQFIVQLEDEGIGIDDNSVTTAAFQLFQEGVQLVDGVDYFFVYNSNTKQAIFTSETTFPFETNYRIVIDRDDATDDGVIGVRDLAGNFLLANQVDGTTQFTVLLTDGVNDAPINSVPADLIRPEDAPVVFDAADGGVISVSDADVHLGTNRLKVTLTATNGTLTLPDTTGLIFTPLSDATDEITFTFEGDVADVNAALDGLIFTPTAEFVGDATVTITTDDQGELSGPPSFPEQDTDTITITYFQVNDAPTFDLAGDPPTVIEDAGLQSVLNFASNMDSGAPNEMQGLTFFLSIDSSTSNLAFTTAPTIDSMTGELTYQTAPDTNGTAVVRVILMDDGDGTAPDDNTSDPQFFTITVTAINDEPNFDLPGDPPAVDEDSGVQTVPGFLTNISRGPATATDEVTQTLMLDVTVLSMSGNLSLAQLTIDPNTGDLVYRAAADTAGNALVQVTQTDNGTAGPAPHDNIGPTRQFTIRINPIADPPTAVTPPSYIIDEGDALTLDASGSFDPDEPLGDVLSFSWDLNGDGDFSDLTGETPTISYADLFNNFGFDAPGVHPITLRVTDALDGGTRRSDEASSTVIVQAVDYGDLPDTYGTLKTGGAAHTLVDGFFLGAGVSKETDGQPDPLADADTEDDGITFTSTIETSPVVPLLSPFEVEVGGFTAGKLDAWIDFNENGVFDHPAEHLNGGLSYDVLGGTITLLQATVPAGTTPGTKAARFRLSSIGSLTPDGRTSDGEVEDMLVDIITLQPPVVPDIFAPTMTTTDRTPTFEWTEDTANVSYQFRLLDSIGGTVEDRTNLGDPTFTVPSDLPYGQYTANVRGFNRAGDMSAWSSDYIVSVVPVAPVLINPIGRVNDSTPTFGWTGVADVEGYTLIVDNLSTGVDEVINVDVTDTIFTAFAELPLGRYSAEVQAFGGGVAGAFSPAQQFTVVAAPIMTSPDALTFEEMPLFEWDAPLGSGTFQLRVRPVGSTDDFLNVSDITQTNFRPTDPIPIGTYRAWVRTTAVDDPTVVSDWSPVNRFKVVVPPVMDSPTGRTTDNTPTFTWNGVVGGETYELRVHNLSMGAAGDNIIRVSGIDALSFTAVDELPIGRYRATVRAINPLGQLSEWSNPVDFQVVNGPEILAPTGSFFNKQPVFRWGVLPGADRYEIRVHRLASGNPDDKTLNYIRVDNLTEPELRTPYPVTGDPDRPQLPNAKYRFWVRGIARDGMIGEWSPATEFVIGGIPTLDELGTTGDRTPTFTWAPVSDAASYVLRIRRISDNSNVLRRANLTSTEFTPVNPLEPDNYRAWLRAISSTGKASRWSVPMDFTITASGEFVPGRLAEPGLPADQETVVGDGFQYVAMVDVPATVRPVVDVTQSVDFVAVEPGDAATELIELTPEDVRPVLAEGTEAPADGVDDVLADWPMVDWWQQAPADAVASTDDESGESPRLAGGLLGAALGAAFLRRRRRGADRKGRDREMK